MRLSTYICAALSVAFLVPSLAMAEGMTREDILNGYKKNAVLAQFYRWYQVYERPDGGIENALNILTKDVFVQSSLGRANGHAEYQERVAQLPTKWQNTHFIENSDVNFAEDGSATLTANISYLNTGMAGDGSVRLANLKYTIDFVPGETVLPLIASVVIEPISDGTADHWRDAYAENRMKSLVHYYLAIIEDPSRDAEPARELFDDGFQLNFSSGTIADFDGFKAWLEGPASQVTASTHVMSNFKASKIGDGLYSISMDFDWTGYLPDGTELVAKTRHNWTATNVLTERFARIKTVDVDVLEPFRPKSN